MPDTSWSDHKIVSDSFLMSHIPLIKIICSMTYFACLIDVMSPRWVSGMFNTRSTKHASLLWLWGADDWLPPPPSTRAFRFPPPHLGWMTPKPYNLTFNGWTLSWKVVPPGIEIRNRTLKHGKHTNHLFRKYFYFISYKILSTHYQTLFCLERMYLRSCGPGRRPDR